MEKIPFTIHPELVPGQELWFMNKEKPWLALVAAIKVEITTYEDTGESWYRQLWTRWLNRKHKDYWRYSYFYTVKVDTYYDTMTIYKKDDKWYITDNRQMFLTQEELLNSLK